MKKLFILLFVLFTVPLFSQSWKQVKMPTFRISFDLGYKMYAEESFEDVYGSKGAFIYGGGAQLRIIPFSEVSGLYGNFVYYGSSSEGNTIGTRHYTTTLTQSTFLYGANYAWRKSQTSRLVNWFGVGYATANVEETIGEYGSFAEKGSGYYVEYGYLSGSGSVDFGMVLRYVGMTIDTDSQSASKGSADIGGLDIVFQMGYNF